MTYDQKNRILELRTRTVELRSEFTKLIQSDVPISPEQFDIFITMISQHLQEINYKIVKLLK